MAHEFSWAVIFARIRFGMPGGDENIPDPNRARKWRYLPNSRLWLNVESHRKFSEKDYDLRAKEVEDDFRENVAAPPRDLPAEPEFWKVLTSLQSKPAEVCRMAKQSQYLGGHYLNVLLNHAREFCYSKGNVRYPRAGLLWRSQNRPSSEGKRGDYLARVMAGLVFQNRYPVQLRSICFASSNTLRIALVGTVKYLEHEVWPMITKVEGQMVMFMIRFAEVSLARKTGRATDS